MVSAMCYNIPTPLLRNCYASKLPCGNLVSYYYSRFKYAHTCAKFYYSG